MDKSPTISDVRELTSHKRWMTELAYAEKELEVFHQRARRVVRRFLDERDAIETGQKWFNLYYANTKILKAACYAQLPKPEVKRRFVDYDDDLARVAAEILLRCVSPDGDDPRDTFDPVMRNVVLDRLVSGLSQAWLRLETDVEERELVLEATPYTEGIPNSGFLTGPAPDEAAAQAAAMPQPPGGAPGSQPPQGMAPPGGVPPAGAVPQNGVAPPQGVPGAPPGGMLPPPGAEQPPGLAPPGSGPAPIGPSGGPLPPPEVIRYKAITDQRVCVDYVYWEDFVWSPCRVWEERRWVGRKVYMDKEALEKRFGVDVAKDVPLTHRPQVLSLATYPPGLTPANMAIQMACVYEIWDRLDRKVIWICKDHPTVLDEKDDFLNLVGFEPCPRPMLANICTSNTVPRPDYYMVQDQYAELDQVNDRISILMKACKAIGVYDKSADGVQRMLQEGMENTLVPVDNWAMFAEKGGIKGTVDWLPLEQIVLTLQRLYESREGIKAQIYELTGIADIVRGASKASETLGAQEIKAKFASVRIKDVQDEIATFAGQVLRIRGELMVKHFEPDILLRKSNILRTDDAALAHQAVDLLRSEEGFEWRIIVTSDQMAQADYAMEKQDRIDLLTAITQYLMQAAQLTQAAPQMAPMLINLLKWVVAAFKGSREIEGMLDRELDAAIKAQQQVAAQPPQPTPEEKKVQAEIQKIGVETQAKQQNAQIDAASKMQQAKIKQQTAVMDMHTKMQKARIDGFVAAQKGQQDLQANAMSHQQQMEQMRQESLFDMVDRMSKSTTDAKIAKDKSAAQVQAIRASAKAKGKPH